MNPFIEIVLRAIFAYFSLLILTRLMGKREVSQLNFFDYVVGISIGTLAGSMAIDTRMNPLYLLTALVVFSILQILSAYISLKSKPIRQVLAGSKTALIENGKINQNNMRKTRFNMDDLTSQLREKNVFRLQDVEFAYLETDGKVSVMKKSNNQPLTPSDIQMNVTGTGIGTFLIEEGKINENNLRKQGLTKAWLKDKLKQQDVTDQKEVMFAQVDSLGNLYVDLYEKK